MNIKYSNDTAHIVVTEHDATFYFKRDKTLLKNFTLPDGTVKKTCVSKISLKEAKLNPYVAQRTEYFKKAISDFVWKAGVYVEFEE